MTKSFSIIIKVVFLFVICYGNLNALDYATWIQGNQLQIISNLVNEIETTSDSLKKCTESRNDQIKAVIISSRLVEEENRWKYAIPTISSILEYWQNGTWNYNATQTVGQLRRKHADLRNQLADKLMQPLINMKQAKWESFLHSLMKEKMSINFLPSMEDTIGKLSQDNLLRTSIAAGLIAEDENYICKQLLSDTVIKRNVNRKEIITALETLKNEKAAKDLAEDVTLFLMFSNLSTTIENSEKFNKFINALKVVPVEKRIKILASTDMGFFSYFVAAAILGASDNRKELEKILNLSYEEFILPVKQDFLLFDIDQKKNTEISITNLARTENLLSGLKTDSEGALEIILSDIATEKMLGFNPDFDDLRSWYCLFIEQLANTYVEIIQEGFLNSESFSGEPLFWFLPDSIKKELKILLNNRKHTDGFQPDLLFILASENGFIELGSISDSINDWILNLLGSKSIIKKSVLQLLALRFLGGIEKPYFFESEKIGFSNLALSFLRNDERLNSICAEIGVPLGSWINSDYMTLCKICSYAVLTRDNQDLDKELMNFKKKNGIDAYEFQSRIFICLEFIRLISQNGNFHEKTMHY